MLKVHTDSDLRVLADRLGEVLSAAPGGPAHSAWDPMQPEWVAVPSAGMRTWLSLELASRLGTAGPSACDGVAANIIWGLPGSLRARILEAGRSEEGGGGRHRGRSGGEQPDDPWAVDRLVWAILDVVDLAAADGALEPLPTSLVSASAGSSRYAAARQVADLFDRYHLHRPTMVRSWAGGELVDGVGAPLADHHLWQAHLWRAVSSHLVAPSPPERMVGLLESLRAGTLVADLPDRVCVFGMSLLPGGPGFLELAEAIGVHREVHLFVVTPSPVLGERTRVATAEPAHGFSTSNPGGHPLRVDVDAGSTLTHPLLKSWGRLHFETATALVNAGHHSAVADGSGPVDRPMATTHLTRLQSDLRTDRAPVADLVPDAADDSLEFHACYGPTRQVEVLRDVVLRLLRDHPELQEDDILVVCPDLDTFAPLIESTFGASAHTGSIVRHGGGVAVPRLRYRIADRSIGASAPLVGALVALLDLVAGRFDAPSVLDFLTLAPVRLRHRLDDDDLATITDWVLATRIRWGLDPDQRATHGVPADIVTNTWRAGIDRILVGATTIDADADADAVAKAVGGIVAHSVEGSDMALAGRLADVLWYLGDLAEDSTRPRPVREWIELLRRVTAEMLSVPRDESWQVDRLLRTLGDIADSASSVGDPGTPPTASAAPLTFTDLRRLVAERLDDVEGRPVFFRGGLTVSSLTPLRWVPHRVICMLGMDTAALTVRPADGDDLAAITPLIGDRDRRSELRQSLLETVLSARDHLIVLRDGNNVRTNQEIPMPVALAELHDAVVESVDPDHAASVEARLETEHPRQPYDDRYLGVADPPTGHVLRPTFDHATLAAAEARRRRPPVAGARYFLEQPVDPGEVGLDLGVVTLDELRRFLKNPVRYFVEFTLDMRLPRESDAPTGVFDITLGGLDTYGLGSDLLDRLGRADDPDLAVQEWREVQQHTGAVPPGQLGEAALDTVQSQVLELHARARQLGILPAPVETRRIEVVVDGTTVTGELPLSLEPTAAGDLRGGPARMAFVRRRPEHVLTAWLDLAALTVAYPQEQFRAGVATRASSGPSLTITPVELLEGIDSATTAITRIVRLWRHGTLEPLPILRGVSEALYSGKAVKWPEEYPDPAEKLVFGHLSKVDLLRMPILPTDLPGEGGDRVTRYATLLHGTLSTTCRAENLAKPRTKKAGTS